MNRIFLLMAEFNCADIPLEKVAPKYLGMDEKQWKRAASLQQLPFPVFRGGSQKAPWLVNVNALAQYLDKREAAAAKDWRATA